MKRIIVHWTAGAYTPNEHELNCYHYLVGSKGEVYHGSHKPEDNENCNDGNYAAHTGGGNTGSIGIAACGMLGFESRSKVGDYPLTATQCERLFKLIAEVAKQYHISITPQTVMTHYEFGVQHPSTSSKGKIDIIYLPPFPTVKQGEVGDYIRNKARWYSSKV